MGWQPRKKAVSAAAARNAAGEGGTALSLRCRGSGNGRFCCRGSPAAGTALTRCCRGSKNSHFCCRGRIASTVALSSPKVLQGSRRGVCPLGILWGEEARCRRPLPRQRKLPFLLPRQQCGRGTVLQPAAAAAETAVSAVAAAVRQGNDARCCRGPAAAAKTAVFAAAAGARQLWRSPGPMYSRGPGGGCAPWV